jgi:hypothetical protein
VKSLLQHRESSIQVPRGLYWILETLKFCTLSNQLTLNIAEEVENASMNVTRAMWRSFVLNVAMGLAMLVTMLFCIGDLNTAIDSSAPYLILFQNTGANAWAYALMVILLSLYSLGISEPWLLHRENLGRPLVTRVSSFQSRSHRYAQRLLTRESKSKTKSAR